MVEGNPPRGTDDDGALLKDAVKLLTDEVRLQKELMSLQNGQLQECRQQLEARAEDLHRARQEAVLHHEAFARQAEELRQARLETAVQRDLHERKAEELRRVLNTRFWRYTRPVRRLLGLFASPEG